MDNTSEKKQINNLLGKIIAVIAIAIGFGLLGFKLFHSSALPNTNQPMFVVVNVSKLTGAATKEILAQKDLTPEQSGAVTKKLADNVKKLLGSYRERGYIVINASALLAFPPAMDITPQFAEQLGVKID